MKQKARRLKQTHNAAIIAVLPQLALLTLAASLGLIGIGAIIGTRASSLPQIYALTNIASFAVVMLTPAYYPIEVMPPALRPISLALPTTRAALLARNLLGIGSYDTAKHLALLPALSAAYLALGFRGIKWREE